MFLRQNLTLIDSCV